MAYKFELPPLTRLTIDQQAATNDPNPIALEGGPGTGKTVVSLYRHINNHKQNKSSLMLTYTKTLELYLSTTARSVNDQAGSAVARTVSWVAKPTKTYDEIIVDEAQDVDSSKYNTVKNYATHVSYGADDAQSLYANNTTQAQLRSIFPNNRRHRLEPNFRNSREIMKFVKSVFPNKEVDQDMINDINRSGEKPRLLIGTMSEQKSAIMDIIEQFNSSSHNIAILVPTQNDVDTYYTLANNRFSCSKYSSKEENCSAIDNIHVTTFKSSKGLEFDTVIIPSFDDMQTIITQYNHFSDRDYYVAMTRAKENLYLLASSRPSFLSISATYEEVIL